MDALPLSLTTALSGRYEFQGTLGTGGMARVYLAADLRHGRKVAIKVVRDDIAAAMGTERFLNEIRTTAALQHPHILPLLDSGEADGHLFYVMPFVAGESLRAHMDRAGTIGAGEALPIIRQVASALDHAHRHGIVHRDIKPENVLLADGLPVVADFGIALAASQSKSDRLTQIGMSLGTPSYMSPEQVTGAPEVEARSDQYSLACVLFEMLSGRPPFRGATAQATMVEHVVGPIPPLTSPAGPVAESVERAVRRALSKDPSDR
jgi:serine/threonine-protein kinase